MVYNGGYENEQTAAHASDTLARHLMANGEQGHTMNFPNNETEVFIEKTTSSRYIGVNYIVSRSKWQAARRSKLEKKTLCNGRYDNEETAARASDTLAMKLITNGEQGHTLNFPNDETEVYRDERQRKRKRHHHEDLGHPKHN